MRTRIAIFEKWAHPIAAEVLTRFPALDVQVMQFVDGEAANWSTLESAHVYQARSTRSELPEQFWPGAPLLSRCPDLLAVSTNGSGSDTVDLDACTDAGVMVVNQAGGNKQAVAEHALAMMLTLSKRIIQADRAMRTVTGLQREQYMGNDAHGKTLGIIGLGHIGTHVAKLASGLLSMRVIACDPFIEPGEFSARGAEQVSLEALLEQADFVSVHCPRNASSELMLDAGAYARMKSTAYLITTARGGIHDEAALSAALENGQIAGAGLDVWADEPPPLDHPLLRFDNVLVSPHTAGVTHESRANVVQITVEQIHEISRGERPPRLLNPDVWPAWQQRYQRIMGS